MKCALAGCVLCGMFLAVAPPLHAKELPLQLSISSPQCSADTTAIGTFVVQQLTPIGCAPSGSGLQLFLSMPSGYNLPPPPGLPSETSGMPPLPKMNEAPFSVGADFQPVVLNSEQALTSNQMLGNAGQVKSEQLVLGTVAAFLVGLTSFAPLLASQGWFTGWHIKKFLNFYK